jgi:catechol 2,3-dioxygenase-like lactoylglutathione lyase family enzyme
MSLQLAHVTFDCTNAEALARFWSGVVGLPVDENANPFFATVGLTGATKLHPAYMFLQVPEGKTAKNRVHLDFHSTDLAAEGERVVALGAVKVGDFDEFGTKWSTFLDPEGNEFDIGLGLS